jgi:hypothetical protein
MSVPTWLRATALLGATFAAGVLIGIGYERHQPAHSPVAQPGAAMLVEHLHQLLDLDPAQDSAIRAIVARHQGSVDSIWRGLHPHVRATLDSTAGEISAVLTPEQATKFRSAIVRFHHGRHP